MEYWSGGLMEYWIVGKGGGMPSIQYSITPTPRYSHYLKACFRMVKIILYPAITTPLTVPEILDLPMRLR